MPARTRRSVALAALAADMQVESDAEMEEEQVDVEGEEDEQEVDEGDEDDDGEAEDSQSGGEEEEVPSAVTPTQPRLKITLKLPANNASSTSAGTATPDDAEMDYAAFKRTPKRRAKAKVIQDVDVESEDPSSPSGSDGEQSPQEAPSRSTGTPSATTSTKPMTTRQAVLASVVDPTHVSLDEGTRSKKQPLNETELALRREETARKRKNLSEKKLEDEKAETINRLLKKQSRPRNKRNNTLDDRSPMPSASGSRTPKVKTKNTDDVEDAEGEEDEDEAMDVVEQPEEIKPVMYRWVSSLHSVSGVGEEKVKMGITFSVPEVLFSPPPAQSQDVDIIPDNEEEAEMIRKARGPGICAVEGCGKPRKYRLPKDWTIGACDSTHLRVIANQA